MDKLQVKDGLVYLTAEQARITRLPNPTSLEVLLQDPLVVYEHLATQAEQLTRNRLIARQLPREVDYDGLPGEKLEAAMRIVDERQHVARNIAAQLIPYLIDAPMIDVPVTYEHND